MSEVDDSTVAPAADQVGPVVVVWAAELLEEQGVSGTDNFFGLGGHSLLALELLGRIREQYGVELSIEVLFDQSLGEVAATVGGRYGESRSGVGRDER